MFRSGCLVSLCALLGFVFAGCTPGESARKKMEGQATPSWPAFDALQSGEDSMSSVGMGMGMGGPAAGQKAAATPKFKQLVDDFEKEPIPSTFATSQREAAKKELVANLRKLAEGGSDSAVKELWEKAQAALKTLASP